MGGHTMREGLTVGRSLSAAAIVYLGCMGVNGAGQPRTTEPSLRGTIKGIWLLSTSLILGRTP